MPSPNEEKIMDKNSPQNCSSIVSESPQQPEPGFGSPSKSSFEDNPSPSMSTPINNNIALNDNLSPDFSHLEFAHTSPSRKSTSPSLDNAESCSSEPPTTSDRKNSKSEETTNVIITNNEPANAEVKPERECNTNTKDDEDTMNDAHNDDENDDDYYYSDDEESTNPSTHTHPPRTNSTPQIRKSRHTHSKITHVRTKSRSSSIHMETNSNIGHSCDTNTASKNIDGASEKSSENLSNKASSSSSSSNSLHQETEVELQIPSGGRGRSNAFYIKPQLETPSPSIPGPSRPPRPISFAPPKEFSCSGIARLQNGIQLWRKSSAPLPHQIVNRSSRFLVGFAETIGKRSTMEDEIVIFGGFRSRETDDYFALFDGHGGKDAATFAARTLHEVISENLKNQMSNSPPFANPVRALRESFKEIHELMSHRSIKGGTTAVVVLFIGNTGYVANVGDSRAVLCRDGQTFRVSLDHKPELPKETERIQRLGGVVTTTINSVTGQQTFRVQGQLSVSRALGDTPLHPFVTHEPDIHGPLNISPNHKNQFVILACDGVWDVVQDEEAVNLVMPFVCGANGCDPEAAALKLRDEAFVRGSTDNISVIVVVFPHSLPKR